MIRTATLADEFNSPDRRSRPPDPPRRSATRPDFPVRAGQFLGLAAARPSAVVSLPGRAEAEKAGYFRVESVHNRCAASLADCVIANMTGPYAAGFAGAAVLHVATGTRARARCGRTEMARPRGAPACPFRRALPQRALEALLHGGALPPLHARGHPRRRYLGHDRRQAPAGNAKANGSCHTASASHGGMNQAARLRAGLPTICIGCLPPRQTIPYAATLSSRPMLLATLPKPSPCDMTSALFSPIRLADLELANRIVVSPMCQYSADDGVASEWHLNHLGMLANSGAGLVIAEMTDVERRGRISHGCLGLYSDDCEAALARVVAHCHRYGTAKVGIQLAHAGRKASAHPPWEGAQPLGPGADPWQPIAPSAIAFGADWPVPLEMTAADIEHLREAFATAARRAVRIGFDAIELHAAHGYLLHSFVSPISNKRTDGYGGSPEARMRFPLEVARAVRAVVPKGTPLGARMTGSDWVEGGPPPDDAVTFAKALKSAGLDYVCISSGGITADTRPTAVANMNVQFAEKVKAEAGIATRTVGLIATPKQAEAIVAEGKADMVALARAFLDDPHWAWHAAQSLGADVARPKQYQRAAPKLWPGAAYRDPVASGR